MHTMNANSRNARTNENADNYNATCDHYFTSTIGPRLGLILVLHIHYIPIL